MMSAVHQPIDLLLAHDGPTAHVASNVGRPRRQTPTSRGLSEPIGPIGLLWADCIPTRLGGVLK